MPISAGTVVADAKMNMRGFMRDLSVMKKSGTKAADRIGKKYKALGGRMQSIGRSMTMSLTAPLAAMGAASVKAFSTFDSEMTKSTAIMNNVSKEMRGTMEQAAMSVSEDLNMASSKAAESFFFLASAGLDAEQSVAALPQVAEFAKAGMFDMATATDLATDAQSALGLTVDDAAQNMKNLTKVTDTLVKANTLANASVQQFSEALTNRAAAALRSANKEMEEGVAVLAAFADQGIKGKYAGEQLARILRILSQSAAKNKELFSDLGIIDASGNLASMSDIIKILTQEMAGLSDTAKSAKLEQLGFTARVQASIKPLLGLSSEIKNYQNQLQNASGITEEVANNQMKAFSEQLGVTWQMVRNAGIEIGKMLAPAIGDLNTILRSAITTWRGFSDTTKGITIAVGGLVAAIGPLSFAIGGLIKSLPILTAGFKALNATLLSNPIYAVGAAIAFVGAKAVIANSELNTLHSRVQDVIDQANDLDAVNKAIADIGKEYKKAAENAATVPGMEADDFVDPKTKQQLEALVRLKRELAGKQTQKDINKSKELTTGWASAWSLMEASAKAAAQAAREASEAQQAGQGQSKSPFKGQESPINRVTDSVRSLSANLSQVKIKSTEALAGMKAKVNPALEGMSLLKIATMNTTDKVTQAAQTAGQALGQMFDQALLHGRNFMGVVKNIIKQLASRVFVQGVMAVITGGASLAKGSIGSAIFGGLFHGGGMVPGSGERMIRAKGGEMVLTQSQQKALGSMMSGGQSRTQRIKLQVRGEFQQQGSDLRAVINESQHIDLS